MLLTSLGSAVHLPSPCLLLGMLQAALPSPSRPPACSLPRAERVLLLQTILLRLVTEAVENILWGWETSFLPPPVCFSALSDSRGS